VEPNLFFREATLKICGSLDSEKALWDSLMYLRQHMPVVRLSFHLCNTDNGNIETVGFANPSGSVAISVKTDLPLKSHDQLKEGSGLPPVRIVSSLAGDAITGPVVHKLKHPDTPGIVMKLDLENNALGLLVVAGNPDQCFTEENANALALLNQPFSLALNNCLRFRELTSLSDRLADDNRYYMDELRHQTGMEIIGIEMGLKGVMEMVRQVAHLTSPVLLLGETGVGKEVIANAIHASSLRSNDPFIKVNCGAIPPSLIDSELFGHEKGAFTGALGLKRGRFERAHHGTIFLDEIGELPPEVQVRLLRVLQEKEIERVGGTEPIKLDIRIIAATHHDLEAMAQEGQLRKDLYFRLKVFPIVIPPLRDRSMDIPALVTHFMSRKAVEMGLTGIPSLAPGALERLMGYRWPGNVRELENTVERALILCGGGQLHFADLASADVAVECLPPSDFPPKPMKLDDVVDRHIRTVLTMTEGKIEGSQGASELLGVKPGTLRHRMRKLGIPFGRSARYGPV